MSTPNFKTEHYLLLVLELTLAQYCNSPMLFTDSFIFGKRDELVVWLFVYLLQRQISVANFKLHT